MHTIRTGIDVVDVARLQQFVDGPGGDDFLARTFTPGERAVCGARVERLAARWAAKEAVLKILRIGVDQVTLTDIEITNDPRGAPSLQLKGHPAAIAEADGLTDWSVSMSHDGTMAAAIAVATGDCGCAPSSAGRG